MLLKRGVRRLSKLKIDTTKDWDAKGIFNLLELASSMTRGDILIKGASGYIIRLSPDQSSWNLTSNGAGHEISWQEPPGV